VGGGEWQHAKLHNTGHIAGTGTPASVTAGLVNEDIPFEPSGNPAVGAFIYRSGDGFGTFSTTANKLRWNYAAQGITNATTLEVNVYAIEMVYVPEGEFNVGGVHASWCTPTTINTSDAKSIPGGMGNLGGQAGGYPSNQSPPLLSSWPNGFSYFYCMKYEITQQQYVDFLNSLTPTQSFNRVEYFVYMGTSNQYITRNFIIGNNLGYFQTSTPSVACNGLSFDDGRAFADWAGLRPMTELEYEKACRGNQLPVLYEFAWGNNSVVSGAYVLNFLNQENEGIQSNYSNNSGNANISNPNSHNGQQVWGPIRVGAFSANGLNTGRVSSGASYWGIMELTGNLVEQCIAINDVIGRDYDGAHGDGSLDSNGESQDFKTLGFSLRGGHYYYPREVSNKEYYPYIYRENFWGFRAIRG
jgi:formylglycine-generating enzyme required for sulfatase activity